MNVKTSNKQPKKSVALQAKITIQKKINEFSIKPKMKMNMKTLEFGRNKNLKPKMT